MPAFLFELLVAACCVVVSATTTGQVTNIVKTGSAASHKNFQRILRGDAMSPPGPYGGSYFLTALSGCIVLESGSRRMLSCRLSEERSAFNVLPEDEFTKRFAGFETAIARALPAYRRAAQRCERRNSLRARTAYSRGANDPSVALDGLALEGGYSIDLWVMPAHVTRVQFVLAGAPTIPSMNLEC